MYEKYLNVIDGRAEELCAVADTLWDNPELPYHEFEAVKLLTGKLEENGFTVERGVGGIPTAFTAVYGTKKPVFGILAEYDGLPGMSQQPNVAYRAPIEGRDTHHGCGHNLFAAGSLAAALAMKAYVDEHQNCSVKFFGCPAEEGGSGKVYLAREGVFDGVDAVTTWHADREYKVRTHPALASYYVDYFFEGVTAHASTSAHAGRSALDAVELMNIGVQFLREHMPPTARVHYAITDAGGNAPTMVQSHAKVRYVMRDLEAEGGRALRARVDNIAAGAARMTETTVSSRVVSAYSNFVLIPTLLDVACEALQDPPLPRPTEEDIAYGKALQATMELTKEQKEMPMYAEKTLGLQGSYAYGGATDTSDVSWAVPTVQFRGGTWITGTPGHSWQAASQSRSPYGKRAMLFMGKCMAGTLMRLADSPETLAKAKAEHAEKTAGSYICPIPADVKPPIKK